MLLDLLPHVRNLLLRVPLFTIHMRLMYLRTAAHIPLDAEARRLVGVDHLRSTHAQEACGDRNSLYSTHARSHIGTRECFLELKLDDDTLRHDLSPMLT